MVKKKWLWLVIFLTCFFESKSQGTRSLADGIYVWDGYRDALFRMESTELERKGFAYQNPILDMSEQRFLQGDFTSVDSSYWIDDALVWVMRRTYSVSEQVRDSAGRVQTMYTKTIHHEVVKISKKFQGDSVLLVSVVSSTGGAQRVQKDLTYVKLNISEEERRTLRYRGATQVVDRYAREGFHGNYEFSFNGAIEHTSFYQNQAGLRLHSSNFRSGREFFDFTWTSQWSSGELYLPSRIGLRLHNKEDRFNYSEAKFFIEVLSRNAAGIVTKFRLIPGDRSSNYKYSDTMTFTYIGEPKWGKQMQQLNYDLTKSMMPGVYAENNTGNQDTFGQLFSYGVHMNLLYRIAQIDDRGPSHYRIYAKIGETLLSSETGKQYFTAGIGADFSFERNPLRNWAIPTFGFEYQFVKGVEAGNLNFARSTLGLNLYANRYFAVNGLIMYSYCFERIETLSGLGYGVNAVISLW